jgi:hypothetical protein
METFKLKVGNGDDLETYLSSAYEWLKKSMIAYKRTFMPDEITFYEKTTQGWDIYR